MRSTKRLLLCRRKERYACGEIYVENQEQQAAVWKNDEVLYEYDYANFIELYTILKDGNDLYFGGASYYFGKHPGGRQSSHRVLFKNGEAIEIDPECTSVFALAVSSETNVLQETEKSPLMAFPNPAKDRATFEGFEPAGMQLYNPQGRSVKTFSITNEIDVSDLPKSVYLLQITDREGVTLSPRLVVQ